MFPHVDTQTRIAHLHHEALRAEAARARLATRTLLESRASAGAPPPAACSRRWPSSSPEAANRPTARARPLRSRATGSPVVQRSHSGRGSHVAADRERSPR